MSRIHATAACNYEGAAGDATAAHGMPLRAGIKRQGVLPCTCARHVRAGTTGLYGSWWAYEDKLAGAILHVLKHHWEEVVKSDGRIAILYVDEDHPQYLNAKPVRIPGEWCKKLQPFRYIEIVHNARVVFMEAAEVINILNLPPIFEATAEARAALEALEEEALEEATEEATEGEATLESLGLPPLHGGA